jgi:hypothetical protein
LKNMQSNACDAHAVLPRLFHADPYVAAVRFAFALRRRAAGSATAAAAGTAFAPAAAGSEIAAPERRQNEQSDNARQTRSQACHIIDPQHGSFSPLEMLQSICSTERFHSEGMPIRERASTLAIV